MDQAKELPGIRNADSPVARVFALLEYVVAQARPVAIAEMATALGLSMPTAHRIAVQLERDGYLRRAIGSKRFIIAARLEQLGFKIVESSLQDAPRHAILQMLSDAIGEQCELGVMVGSEVVYIDRARDAAPASLHFEPGHRAPLHCTSIGKLFLARLPDKLRASTLRALPMKKYTPNTITETVALVRELAAVKARGWATSNEEFVVGVVGCGVPVTNKSGAMIAGLAISVPAARLSFAEVTRHVAQLQSGAERLSATLD